MSSGRSGTLAPSPRNAPSAAWRVQDRSTRRPALPDRRFRRTGDHGRCEGRQPRPDGPKRRAPTRPGDSGSRCHRAALVRHHLGGSSHCAPASECDGPGPRPGGAAWPTLSRNTGKRHPRGPARTCWAESTSRSTRRRAWADRGPCPLTVGGSRHRRRDVPPLQNGLGPASSPRHDEAAPLKPPAAWLRTGVRCARRLHQEGPL